MLLLANAGLPVMMVMIPWAILGIVPVILVEAVWYWRFLRVPWDEALWDSGSANLYSTTCGWLIAWLSMVGVQILFAVLCWVAALSWNAFGGDSHGMLTWLSEPSTYPLWFLGFVCCSAWLIPVGMHDGGNVIMLGAVLVMLLPCYVVSYQMEARQSQKVWPDLDPKRVYRHVWYAHMVSYGLMYAVTFWIYLNAVGPNAFRWR
jgi:hypothetical protein